MKNTLSALALCLAAMPSLAAVPADALQPSGRFSVYGHGAAATPPMGWNPWNAFRTEVTQDRILAVVETMRGNGLQAAGYRYINIDDGWWLQRRGDGGIQIRTSMFPMAETASGPPSFRRWTDHLHALGFKAGLYTDVGRNACSQAHDPHSPNLPTGSIAERQIGLEGFEYQDLGTMFQDWGFDYIKVDACGLADFDGGREGVAAGRFAEARPLIVRGDAVRTDADKVETMYARVGRLLAQLNPDNDYVFSICPWGEAGVRDWGGRHGNLWRTSEDIEPTWESMLHNFDSASRRELYAGPGRWNDPDMLAIGLGEFDAGHLVEARTHYSLWSILAAPLLLGFDINQASPELLALLSNEEVIAVNQDRAGNQGRLVADHGQVQVLMKPLAVAGERAVVVVNRGDTPAEASVDADQLKLQDAPPAAVRDLWQRRELPQRGWPLRFALQPHEAVMLKVVGTPAAAGATALGEITGRIHVAADGLPLYNPAIAEASGTPRVDVTPYGAPLRIAGRRYGNGIGAHANSRLEVLAARGFERFTALAGVDDGSEGAGRVVFRVYGDGRLLHRSGPLRRGDAPVRIDVPVSGVEVLELVAAAEGTESGALPPLVDWADALLH